jgi:hypothetical protein
MVKVCEYRVIPGMRNNAAIRWVVIFMILEIGLKCFAFRQI